MVQHVVLEQLVVGDETMVGQIDCGASRMLLALDREVVQDANGACCAAKIGQATLCSAHCCLLPLLIPAATVLVEEAAAAAATAMEHSLRVVDRWEGGGMGIGGAQGS